MRKAEAESLIRSEVHDWASENGFKGTGDENPSFELFFSWLNEKYPELTHFRSVMRAPYDIEMWFAEELRQSWKY